MARTEAISFGAGWRRPARAVLAALALVAPGCTRGADGPPSGPTNVQTAPQRTLILQGNFSLAGVSEARRAGVPYDAWRHEFTTAGTGLLEVNADWTFGSSLMGIIVARGSCSFSQLYAEVCPEAGGQFPASKPGRVTIANLAPGTYTLLLLNAGNSSEAGNYQVFLTR